MKQKDIALIAIIAIISGMLSFFISNKVFVTSQNRSQQAEVVDPINADFQAPDKRYFNANSIDPTPSNSLGDSNQTPFDGGTGQ